MRDHTKFRAFELADEVVRLIYLATWEFSKTVAERKNDSNYSCHFNRRG